MSAVLAQPIAGVSSGREADIEAIYPSIAQGGLGRLIGTLMGAAGVVPFTPLRILAQLFVGSLLVPLALLAYAVTKLVGPYYQLTNRSVRMRRLIGGKLLRQVLLADIADIRITTRGGYEFHRVGDLQLIDSSGQVLMTLAGISYPQRLQQIISDARDARLRSDESLATIRARNA